MAITSVTKPMALDETLQATNTILATLGLNNVGNMASLTTTDKTSLVAAVNELNAGKVANSEVGIAGGVAELDSTGKVPAAQLPAFVDDVIEGYYYNAEFYYDSAHTQLITPESGKIYVDLTTEKTYRWGGSAYVVISDTLALGETSTTAYRGDRGKTAYDHSQDANRITSAVAEGLYKVGGTAQGHISSLSPVAKADLTDLGVADDNDVQAIEEKMDETTTSISGNPISISGLKANQLAINPIITLEPIQDLHGQSKPYPAGGGKNKFNIGWVYTTSIFSVSGQKITKTTSAYNADLFSGNTGQAQPSAQKLYLEAGTYTLSYTSTESTNIFVDSIDSSTLVPNGGIATSCPSGGGTSFTVSTASWVCLKVTSNLALTISNLQIESGSQPTAYAPYENICPISGYDKIEVLSCGKNLVEDKINYTSISAQGEITASGTTDMWLAQIKKGTAYVITSDETLICGFFTSKPVSGSISYDGSRRTSSTMYFTAPIDGWVAFRSTHNYTTPQLEYGTTATTYVPYNKATSISESLGQTVYGATWYPRTGKLVCKQPKKIKLSSLTWGYGASSQRFYSDVISDADKSGQYTINELISSMLPTANVYNQSGDGICLHTDGRIYVRVSGITDVTTLTNTYGDTDICYTVTTPMEIQFTPHEISLLKDYAYVSTNGTTIALDYHNGELASLADVNQLAETVEKSRFHRYSTDEQVVGSWIDGSTIYEKTIDCGVLPNNTGKWVDHNISGYKMLIDAYGIAFSTTRNETICVPFVHRGHVEYQIQLSFTSTQIGIFTGSDRTEYNKSYIVMRYIKS